MTAGSGEGRVRGRRHVGLPDHERHARACQTRSPSLLLLHGHVMPHAEARRSSGRTDHRGPGAAAPAGDHRTPSVAWGPYSAASHPVAARDGSRRARDRCRRRARGHSWRRRWRSCGLRTAGWRQTRRAPACRRLIVARGSLHRGSRRCPLRGAVGRASGSAARRRIRRPAREERAGSATACGTRSLGRGRVPPGHSSRQRRRKSVGGGSARTMMGALRPPRVAAFAMSHRFSRVRGQRRKFRAYRWRSQASHRRDGVTMASTTIPRSILEMPTRRST